MNGPDGPGNDGCTGIGMVGRGVNTGCDGSDGTDGIPGVLGTEGDGVGKGGMIEIPGGVTGAGPTGNDGEGPDQSAPTAC